MTDLAETIARLRELKAMAEAPDADPAHRHMYLTALRNAANALFDAAERAESWKEQAAYREERFTQSSKAADALWAERDRLAARVAELEAGLQAFRANYLSCYSRPATGGVRSNAPLRDATKRLIALLTPEKVQ